jgi:hypothetical protein
MELSPQAQNRHEPPDCLGAAQSDIVSVTALAEIVAHRDRVAAPAKQ